ncbi:MAG: hypothetical protein HOW97_17160 [Catenulispora sp.]|nr:hypothetical protein [Catenulispora sp.]
MFLGRIVAPGDPLWTDDDRDWAMALMTYEADLCTCGQPRSESMNADNEFAYAAEPLRCHACKAIARGSESFASANDAAGLFISVTKRTRRAHAGHS